MSTPDHGDVMPGMELAAASECQCRLGSGRVGADVVLVDSDRCRRSSEAVPDAALSLDASEAAPSAGSVPEVPTVDSFAPRARIRTGKREGRTDRNGLVQAFAVIDFRACLGHVAEAELRIGGTSNCTPSVRPGHAARLVVKVLSVSSRTSSRPPAARKWQIGTGRRLDDAGELLWLVTCDEANLPLLISCS